MKTRKPAPFDQRHSLALDTVQAALDAAPPHSDTTWLKFIKTLLEADVPAVGTAKKSAA
jgi:hypothetical protein